MANVICLSPGDGCNLAAEFLRQVFGFLPGALDRPYRCADEICSVARNPQIFIENKNVVLFVISGSFEKAPLGCSRFRTSQSRMNYDAFHVAAVQKAFPHDADEASQLFGNRQQFDHPF